MWCDLMKENKTKVATGFFLEEKKKKQKNLKLIKKKKKQEKKMCAHLKTHRVLQPRHLWKQYRYNIDSQKKKNVS